MSAFAMNAVSDAERYEAIRARDRAADFYYGVETTGVFCKPSCGARLPLRKNVRFFADVTAAQRAGFRPCKRCKPLEKETSAQIVARVCAVLDESPERVSLDALAGVVGLSPYHLHRVFKAATGLTPREYAQARRRDRAQTALRDRGTVTNAMYEAGFESSGRFYEEANGALGMTPSAFKKRGAGVAVRYALARCSLGRVLVAAGDRGICAVYLGSDPDKLVADLRESFANALSVKKDDALADWVRLVVEHIDTGKPLDLPLELRGTVFQERVWNALREIPEGETLTYAQLAAKIGAPKAVRAVGSACGRNEVSVLVPCHRAVGSDGKMHGYRWGTDIKVKLLEVEARRRK